MRRAGAALLAAIAFAVAPLSLDAQASRLHVLRFADGQDATHLNPLLVVTYPEAYPAQLTGAYLTRLGHHGDVLPELAREIPSRANGGISADGKTLVFHLRPNLRFSDGSPLTADDAVFTANVIIGIVRTPSPYTGFTGFQTQRPPLNDPRVRLALRYAIDRNRLLATGRAPT